MSTGVLLKVAIAPVGTAEPSPVAKGVRHTWSGDWATTFGSAATYSDTFSLSSEGYKCKDIDEMVAFRGPQDDAASDVAVLASGADEFSFGVLDDSNLVSIDSRHSGGSRKATTVTKYAVCVEFTDGYHYYPSCVVRVPGFDAAPDKQIQRTVTCIPTAYTNYPTGRKEIAKTG